MNAEWTAAWEKLERAPLVSAAEDVIFARKLVLQNAWTSEFAYRCLLEYRRFAFLAVNCGHPVSPPDAVDQVWHLHLTYTAAYWKTFCPEVLGRALHHAPSKGGEEETVKFQNWYEQTLESYRSFFGEEPRDIWPEPSKKRDEDRRIYRRVDTGRHWILPRPAWLVKRSLPMAGALMLLLLPGCAALDGISSGCQMDGPTFLAVYSVFLVGTIVLCAWVRRILKGPPVHGIVAPELDLYEKAFLAGGANRVLQALTVRMHAAGAAEFDGKGRLTGKGRLRDVLDPMETDVRQSVDGSKRTWTQLRETVQGRTGAIRHRLETLGLLVRRSDGAGLHVAAEFVAGIVFVIGALRIWHGITLDRPVGVLVFLLAVGTVVMIVLTRPPFRTRRGDRVLELLQGAHRLAPSETDDPTGSVAASALALSVGLLGAQALEGTPMEKLRQHFGTESSHGCGGGCGTSGGDGGCGGGCGGCGGCGG